MTAFAFFSQLGVSLSFFPSLPLSLSLTACPKRAWSSQLSVVGCLEEAGQLLVP